MNCKFCNIYIGNEYPDTITCNNCWAVYARLRNMPVETMNKIIKAVEDRRCQP